MKKEIKTKKCKNCDLEFTPFNSLQKACGVDCALKLVDKDKQTKVEKARKTEIKRVKAKLKVIKKNNKGYAIKAAQKAFNAFIRKRDELLDCISCNRTNDEVAPTDGWKVGGSWDCGHYLTRGAFPELRFEELNAHKQCKSCNGGSDKYAKKTQLVKDGYRINLINKIGLHNVEWLEGPHEPLKLKIDEIWEIEKEYKDKLKELELI